MENLHRYQILNCERWLDVDYNIFRSWTGNRMMDNKPYYGPVFWFMDQTVHKYSRKPQPSTVGW